MIDEILSQIQKQKRIVANINSNTSTSIFTFLQKINKFNFESDHSLTELLKEQMKY